MVAHSAMVHIGSTFKIPEKDKLDIYNKPMGDTQHILIPGGGDVSPRNFQETQTCIIVIIVTQKYQLILYLEICT